MTWKALVVIVAMIYRRLYRSKTNQPVNSLILGRAFGGYSENCSFNKETDLHTHQQAEDTRLNKSNHHGKLLCMTAPLPFTASSHPLRLSSNHGVVETRLILAHRRKSITITDFGLVLFKIQSFRRLALVFHNFAKTLILTWTV